MAYRDDLEAALQKAEDLRAREKELVAELEAERARAERAKRAAEAYAKGGREPPGPLRHPVRWAALALACTLLGYVLTIAMFDSAPVDHASEIAFARIATAIPFVASMRIWWMRRRDLTWLGFLAARSIVLLVGVALARTFSTFDGGFVFFWWAPPLSVFVLLVELFAASKLR